MLTVSHHLPCISPATMGWLTQVILLTSAVAGIGNRQMSVHRFLHRVTVLSHTTETCSTCQVTVRYSNDSVGCLLQHRLSCVYCHLLYGSCTVQPSVKPDGILKSKGLVPIWPYSHTAAGFTKFTSGQTSRSPTRSVREWQNAQTAVSSPQGGLLCCFV